MTDRLISGQRMGRRRTYEAKECVGIRERSKEEGEMPDVRSFSGANHRHNLTGIQCRRLFLDLREIACLQFPGRTD